MIIVAERQNVKFRIQWHQFVEEEKRQWHDVINCFKLSCQETSEKIKPNSRISVFTLNSESNLNLPNLKKAFYISPKYETLPQFN